jgi:hypothetical protein
LLAADTAGRIIAMRCFSRENDGAAMEHRWGKRSLVDIGVRISARRGVLGVGQMLDWSMSGAWIRARLNISVLTRVMVLLTSSPAQKHETHSIGAYVTRTSQEGFGVEWDELAPSCLAELVQPQVPGIDATRAIGFWASNHLDYVWHRADARSY